MNVKNEGKFVIFAFTPPGLPMLLLKQFVSPKKHYCQAMELMREDVLIRLGWHHKIDPDTILLLKADCNYTQVYLANGTMILSSTTLGILQKRLSAYQFFRPNRSTLINLNYLVDFEKDTATIKLANNELIHISRRRTKQARRSMRQSN
ncbi:LytTR family DNA-binding domain-containing protein [Emticicia sp. C21]|uniref:LytR/AlgR family response regulator transcription factor n=1 Tax=Emticicia sp. C21 TaxID=2302915 RepID=UPI0013148A8F|nr:LytTR family DNA-binding domain-containing protein [Emticicia sp. C21]